MEGRGHEPGGIVALMAAFRAHAGGRLWLAAGLILLASVLEGAGVLLLVPLVSIVVGGGEGAGRAGEIAVEVFRALGAETVAGQMAIGLSVFLAVVGVRAAVDFARSRVMIGLATGFVVALRARVFGALARAPWRAVAGLDRAEAGHSLSADLDRAADFVWSLWTVAIAGVALVVYSVIALAVSPAMTAIALLFGGLLFLGLRPMRRRAGLKGRALSDADAGLFGQTGRFLAGLKPARAHRMTDAYCRQSVEAAERVAERTAALRLDIARAGIVMQTAVAVAGALLVLVSVVLVEVSTEALIAMLLILVRIFRPFQSLQLGIQNMASDAAAYEAAEARMARVLAHGPEEATAGAAVPEAAPGFRLEQVTVTADGGALLLDAVEAEVPAGRVTLVAGLSGAGKTTFCDLLTGLIAPESGRVLIDEVPADATSLARLGLGLAYVGQEPFLAERTVRENLAWGARVGMDDDAALWQALESVGARGLVEALPAGLDTEAGADAMRFSGGERQRLRLARALLRRPVLVVLDEATNALDTAAEAAVLTAMRRALPEATVVLVSHRPAALAHADHVLWLERGRLVEAGEASALLADPGSRVAKWRGLAAG